MSAKIQIGGSEAEVHYGVNAVRAIERELEKPVQQLFVDAYEKKTLSIDAQVVIIWAGLLAKRRNLTVSQVGDLLGDDEFLTASSVCQRELSVSFTRLIGLGGEEPREEEEKNV